MLKALIARLKQGFRTGQFPPAAPALPPDFRGRPQIDDDISPEEFARAQAACPVRNALYCDFEGAKLDMGRCIFCGRCAEVCDKIRFTKEYRLGVFKRTDLIVRAGDLDYEPPRQTDAAARALRHSLSLREVSAGGCGACELDANVLGTLAWDMGRFGIRFVASPRHADAIYLTGPVSQEMQLALDKTYAAAPEPKFLIAAGACAISGGLYDHGNLPATPALFIPGCPPHPATTLEALLRFTGRAASMAMCALAAASALFAGAAEKPAPAFDLLAACPGEDCSRQMRIVWHSPSPDCVLGYMPADGGARPAKAKCEKAKAPVEYTGQTNYWKYTATLDNLKPGTKYSYRVASGGAKSPAQTFKTAGTGGEYSFLWMGDVHSTPAKPKKMESVALLVGNAEKAAHCKIDFVLSTGDLVKHGQTYSNWREWNGAAPFANYMLAYVPGNKEYYRDKGKTRWHNRWFAAARNNPPNGAPGLESTFWFIYDGVMFVAIDTLAGEAKELDDEQRNAARKGQLEWFEKAATAQRGRYQYLVAFQHYPYFKKDGPSGYGNYEKWQPIFDRCGVDFALSGDSHSYVRSKHLKDGKEDPQGTVYVVCPEIDGYLGEADIRDGEGLVAKYDGKSSSYGACWFSVGKGEMTMHYFCKEAKDIDSVTVKAKRPPAGKRK